MPFRFRDRRRSLSSRASARRSARLGIEALEQRLTMTTWGFTSTFAGAANEHPFGTPVSSRLGFETTFIPHWWSGVGDPPPPPVFTHISQDTGVSSTDAITTDNSPILFGYAEPLSRVDIYRSFEPQDERDASLSESKIGSTTADASGKFSFEFTGQPNVDGTYTFTATAANDAGVSRRSHEANVTIDRNPSIVSTPTYQNVATRLKVEYHPALSGEVTHFRISEMKGGTYYFADGVTRVPEGAIVTVAEGAAGFVFEPNSRSDGSLRAQYMRSADMASRIGTGLVDEIEVRAATNYFAVAADAGAAPHVRVYDARTGAQIFDFYAFNPKWKGGVRVAVGDTNRDGVDDIVVAAGEGGGPHVKVFSGVDLSLLGEIMAYGMNFRGGVNLALGEVDGRKGENVALEIITGAGAGGGPHVKIWTLSSGGALAQVGEFFAFDLAFRGGVTLATTQIDNDYLQEIVVGAGPGGGPHVRVFDRGDAGFYPSSVDFFAYDPSFKGGVFVAGGPLHSGLTKVIVTGAGAGGTAHVKVFNATSGALVAETFAYDAAFTGGVRVALLNVDRDDDMDIVTAPGKGGAAHIRAFDGRTLAALDEFFAFEDTFRGGVFPAAFPVRP